MDIIYSNEAARALLKQFWRGVYSGNLQLMMPGMAAQLDAGYVYSVGVKFSLDGQIPTKARSLRQMHLPKC